MQTIERINSTKVRHEWKNISAGVAAGKTFVVENHGKPEALISAPDKREATLNLDDYFARLKKTKPVKVEIFRAPEL
jgi:hypothetical protein